MPAVTVPVCTSYFQFDQQGVVFNMWYFGWFDDAMTQFLGEVGYPYAAMNADGFDVQLVHTEADWHGAVRYGEQVMIDVTTERVGSTSFTLSFSVRVGAQAHRDGCQDEPGLAAEVPDQPRWDGPLPEPNASDASDDAHPDAKAGAAHPLRVQLDADAEKLAGREQAAQALGVSFPR